MRVKNRSALGVAILVVAAFLISGAFMWGLADKPDQSIGGRDTHAIASVPLHRPADTSADQSKNPSQQVTAPSLSELLPGLEAKVSKQPGDRGSRLLLAQTYSALGRSDEAVKLLRQLRSEDPKDGQSSLHLAYALKQLGTEQNLREAFKLLDLSAIQKPELEHTARLYQGDIQLQLGNNRQAVNIWRAYLAQIPEGDARRAAFETKLASVSIPGTRAP